LTQAIVTGWYFNTGLVLKKIKLSNMGCDIHLYAEVKKEGKWVNIDKYSKNNDFGEYEGEREFTIAREDRFYTGGRMYNLFAALCGVRDFEFSNTPPKISEPKGLPDDVSAEVKLESDEYGSDGHSHSWNTLRELKEFDWSSYGKTCDRFKQEVIPKMEAQGVPDEEIRIVYFFDN
jgi:hypothetical protein